MKMYKQVIIIRKDLDLGKGKLVAQGAHASIGALRKVSEDVIVEWEASGSKKIVLRANDMKELKQIENELKKAKVDYFLVKDGGLTQIKPGTHTAIGIGPISENKIDKITGKLKLL